MKIRDRIIQYIKLLEYTVDLLRQRNNYQKLMDKIPAGSNTRDTYLQAIRELDEIIDVNLLQLQKLKVIQPF